MIKKIIENELCCMCGACVNICPQKCINFEENELTTKLIVDYKKCINCNLCSKVCPIENAEYLKNKVSTKCISYRTEDATNLKNCTSGGAFYDICKLYDNGNTVFVGAKTNGLNIEHSICDNIIDLKKFQKSKYAKSNTLDIFNKVIEELKRGKQVLFSGTPCQNAAMKKYLFGRYSNKILFIDIICHGTPSNKILKKYLLEKYKNQINTFEFRNKEKYNNNLVTKIYLKNKNKYLFPQENKYLQMFENGYFFMDSCYNCQFSTLNRVGDITIGDFWGIEKLDSSMESENMSIIIANSDKGKDLVSLLSSKYKKEYYLEDAINNNGNLIACTKKPQDNDRLLKKLYNCNFEETVKNNVKKISRIKIFIRKHLPKKIIRLLKKIKII